MKTIQFWLMAWLAVSTAGVFSQQIETDIIQVKMGRLYLGGGAELGLSPGAAFNVVCGGATTTRGIIEYVGPGVSFSKPISGLDTARITISCRARVAIIGVDSTAIIRLGTDLPLRLFDPAHETLLHRQGDSLLPNLADSVESNGNSLVIFLAPNIRFSEGGRLDAATLALCFKDMKSYGRSFLARFFFARLLPPDSGGIDILAPLSLRLTFWCPFPLAPYFLSHPDFAVYDLRRDGTGPLIEQAYQVSGQEVKRFRPNPLFRGGKPAFAELEIMRYDQSFRMKSAFEEKLLDGYVGFGFDDPLARGVQARALFPEVVALMAGLGSAYSLLSNHFDPDKSHLYFSDGQTVSVSKWASDVADSLGSSSAALRSEPGIVPAAVIPQNGSKGVMIAYDDPLLKGTADYLADRMRADGLTAMTEKTATAFDVRLSLFPASDDRVPFALIAAVLELNDQDASLPADRRLNRPGWNDLDRALRAQDPGEWGRFLKSAEDAITGRCRSFSLFRATILAVAGERLKNLAFDSQGYPVLQNLLKLKPSGAQRGGKTRP